MRFVHTNSGGLKMPSDDDIRRIIANPTFSDWFRCALQTALERDPVDAANDAGLLALVLDKRASGILARSLIDSIIERTRN
jgi:hypothetical protein